ncbi:sensor histidine kinase [Nocardiopsis ganjiahuensis]|uniref:sensor histidine kinase n=1 Tax=Nocardiopsis ganjiahuensis TaxID=239984 RepID=UPI000A07230B|nr:histidine kinase [Nocardiopsis ganjiahuensis]
MGGTGGATPARYAVDVAFALFYVFVDPATSQRLTTLGQAGTDPREWAVLALLLAIPAGVVLRWKYPRAAFLTVLTATLASLLGGWGNAPPVAAAWALYPLALTSEGVPDRLRPRPVGWGIAAAVPVVLSGAALLWDAGRVMDMLAAFSPLALLPPIVMLCPFALAWLLGRVVRERHLRERHETADAIARARNRERLRVAREVHDVVSHALGVVGVRAGVGRHVHGDDPRALRAALEEIEQVSRAATDELRLVLRALRVEGEAPLRPQPGPADLEEIADTARAAGLECTVSAHGVDALPGAVAVSVFRLVQESVTNAIRHAPGTTCTVTVAGEPGAVTVEVADTGPADGAAHPRAPGSGTGQLGMSERVALLGGTFTAGPVRGGGYRVRARIPLDPGAPPGAAVAGTGAEPESGSENSADTLEESP